MSDEHKAGPAATVTHGGVLIKIYHVSAGKGKTYRFTIPGRKPVNRVDLDEAKTEARREAALVVAGISSAVKQTDITELIAARRLVTPLGIPLLSALEEYVAAKALAGANLLSLAKEHSESTPVVRRVTLREAWDECLTDKDADGTKATQVYGAKAKAICTGLGADTKLDRLTTEMIDTWAKSIKDRVTRNDLIGRLAMMLRWARRKKLWPKDRALPSDDASRAKETRPEIGILTPGQFKQVLELVRRKAPQYLACTAIAGFAGVRSDELHGKKAPVGEPRSKMPRQRWEHIHVSERGVEDHLNVSEAKENTPAWRLTPIQPALAAYLKICSRTDGEIYVCPAGAMERVRELCREAKKKGLLNFDLPNNCFRHSAITYRIPFVGIGQTAEESGNSEVEIVARYRRPMLKKDAAPWWAIRP